MKANLQFERIGTPYSGITGGLMAQAQVVKEVTGFNLLEGFKHHSDWVAEIVGFNLRFRYERKFLQGKADYAHANSKGSRGVIVNHILEDGKVYEVNCCVSWSKDRRYFCTVRNGDIVELSEGEVIECLKNRLGLTSSRQPASE